MRTFHPEKPRAAPPRGRTVREMTDRVVTRPPAPVLAPGARAGRGRPGRSVAAAPTRRPPGAAAADRRPRARGDGPTGWRTEERRVPVRTGPERDVAIELDTRLYVPDNATARHPEAGDPDDPRVRSDQGRQRGGRHRGVLRLPRLRRPDLDLLGLRRERWLHHAAVGRLGRAQRPPAHHRVLEPRAFVARDRRGVRVGTIGGSYGGGIQLPAGRRRRPDPHGGPGPHLEHAGLLAGPQQPGRPGRPHRLRARPQRAGGLQAGVDLAVLRLGQRPARAGQRRVPARPRPPRATPRRSPAPPGARATTWSCAGPTRCSARPGTPTRPPRRLLARAAASTFLDDVDVPVLLVQGQSDTLFNLNDAVATYTGLRAAGRARGDDLELRADTAATARNRASARSTTAGTAPSPSWTAAT